MIADEIFNNLRDAVRRHRNYALVGCSIQQKEDFEDVVGVVEIGRIPRDLALDELVESKNGIIFCRRILECYGYVYQVICPIEWTVLLYRALVEEVLYQKWIYDGEL